MTPAGESILYSIVASIICDVGKYGLGRFKNKKMTFETKDAEKYVSEHLDKKYEVLSNSGIMEEFLKSSLIVDIINNYTIYAITGQLEAGLALKGIEKKTKSKCFEELDVVNFLTENSYGKYIKAKAIMVPEKQLLQSFFKDIFALCSDYILGKLSLEESAKLYFISNKINILGNGVVSRLDKIESTLEKSMHSEVVYSNEKLLEDKKYYTKILKDNHRMAHIYLLDKFDINKFYVPPFLTCRIEKGRIVPPIYRMNMFNDGFEDWKYIFERSNIVYVTGGAGYGKSLFMKKLIGEYEKLNIIDANEYMVIYGELKNFFVNNASDPLPVVDFLQNSMKRETLIEEMRVSKELINYYLKRGRCIILFDALDEVDKEKRQDLHSHVIHYFKNQNPNNKICITSRSRGFLPEKDIEVFEIEPLDRVQIQTYVDNIIKLGKFDVSDREAFLKQTGILVKKGFLNSFLVLSLLINIYKAERELPENKLELYQKCFEYISNKREKEKSQDKYDWTLISTLMKDNTFMELANLCLPNNSDVNKEIIKERLTQIYKTKYVSENQTELAIDQFLIFCSDRTELFVPASGEDCFKFFHRSFFEYFYSQYIFTRMSNVEEIYNAWRTFDVDSEIFELTLAMFKQKNESKYQEIIEFLLKKLKDSFNNNTERINVMNMLILCMQVIDDELYKRQFVEFIEDNVEFCKKNIREIHNQRFIINVINSNNNYKKMIIDQYGDSVIYDSVMIFLKIFPEIERFIKQNKKTKDLEQERGLFKYRFYRACNDNFYSQIYFSSNTLKEVIENLSSDKLNRLGKRIGVKSKELDKIQRKYKKYMSLTPEIKEYINEILLQGDMLATEDFETCRIYINNIETV